MLTFYQYTIKYLVSLDKLYDGVSTYNFYISFHRKEMCVCVCTYIYIYIYVYAKTKTLEIVLKFPKAGKFWKDIIGPKPKLTFHF